MKLALRPAAPLLLFLGFSASALSSEAPTVEAPGASLAVEPHHSLVAHLVAGSLQSYHFASRPIDDDVAGVWLDAFLDRVDSGRVYLHAADVAEFKARASEIDDDIRAFRPRMALAMAIQERVAQRAQRALALSEEVVAQPIKFDDTKAQYAPRGDDPAPFADQAAADAWWRQRAQAEVLDVVLGGESMDRAREIVARRNARRARDLRARSTNDVLETYLSALASVYDPHSAYFAPTTSDDFDIRMADALEGIGAELRAEDQYTKVNRLIPGGPAEASGLLRRGDLILAVAQGGGAPVDVVDMRLDEVVKLIRGKKGTEVRLTVRPAGATDPSETRVVPIVRDRVRLEAASAKGRLHEVPDGKGAARKVGVVEVPSFYYDSWAAQNGEPKPRSTTVDVERAVYELRAQQAEVIVLDLRGNGGGVLNEAVNVAGLFIDRGPVVQVLDPKRGAEVLRDKNAGHVWAGPLVVLTDELSASASEIVAGALQDHGRAIVVGSKQTHGKGTVQSVIDLGDVLRDGAFREFSENAGALKITVQKFYRISGESTQTRGVVSDVVLPSPWEGLDVLEGDLPRALPYDTIAPARYTPLPMTIDLDPIREASASRVASEPVFGWFAEDATEIAARSGGAPLSLHLATRQKERAQNAARVDARRAHLGLPKGDGSDEDEDEDDVSIGEALDRVVLAEALRVAVDFADRWTTPPALLASERAIRITEGGGEAGDKGAKKR
jgi:carboxyl-terminal processing protease